MDLAQTRGSGALGTTGALWDPRPVVEVGRVPGLLDLTLASPGHSGQYHVGCEGSSHSPGA